jgi:thioredoxin-dependent peroxiredoxin
MLKVGDLAPEIDKVASDGRRFVLSEQTGLCTVVYFFPRAFTTGCTAEAEHFRDNRAELVLAGASVVGISTDDHDTQCRFAASVKASFPLIADNDGSIARAWGTRWPVIGWSRRITFIVGEGRRIEAVFHNPTIVPRRPSDPLAFVDDVLAFVHRRRGGGGAP